MKKILLAIALTLAASTASASTSPYTLHSASMAYIRTLERTCSVEKAEAAAGRQLEVARRSDEKSQALRDFFESGKSITEHVIETYATRYQLAVDVCTCRD